MLKKFLVLSVFVSCLSAEMLSRTKVGMGTFITISVEKKNEKHIEKCFKIMKEVELAISSYDENSPVYKLNRDKKSKIDKLTYEAFCLSQKYYKKSEGYFDITIGSITKDLYRFAEQERVPSSKELEEADVSFESLTFNENEAFLTENIKLDLGGMGKGFGVDKVVKYLKQNNIDKAIVSASGDIRCLGECSISVQNPFDDGVLLSFETKEKEMGISTSGNYNRYVESKKHNHLIDPKNKKSQDKFVSITLISKIQNSDLDAYATAASVMSVKKAYEFLNSMELAYIVVQSNGRLIFSDNISSYTKNLVINDAFKKQPSTVDNQSIKQYK